MVAELPWVALTEFDVLLARARVLAGGQSRRLLGITGAPGAGKSTLAERLVAALAPHAVLAPMDGFHLAESELARLGNHDRKGAIDTFDAGGFVALLRRLRAADEPVVYAPAFRRDLEEAVAGAIAVPAGVPLVVTEGNYLLAAGDEWSRVRSLLDEVWYLELAEEVRVERLVRRHMAFGRTGPQAQARALGSDQSNAELIAATRSRADLIVAGTSRCETLGRA